VSKHGPYTPPAKPAATTETPRTQEAEPEWLCLCLRKRPGSYHVPGGWEMRVGRIPEGRVPSEQVFEPNLLDVIIGHAMGVICNYRDGV
jgi:hypothetical protein